MGLTRNYDNILVASQLPSQGPGAYYDLYDNKQELISMSNDQLYLLNYNGIEYCKNYYSGANLFNELELKNNEADLYLEYQAEIDANNFTSPTVHTCESNLVFGHSVDPEDYDNYMMEVYTSSSAEVLKHTFHDPVYDKDTDTWSRSYTKRYKILKPMTITEIGIYRSAVKLNGGLGKVLLYRKRLITESEIQEKLERGEISQGDIDEGIIKPEAIIITDEDEGKVFDITFTATVNGHPHCEVFIDLVPEEETE